MIKFLFTIILIVVCICLIHLGIHQREYFSTTAEFTVKDGYTAKLVHPGVGKGAQHMAMYNDLLYVRLLEKNANGSAIVVLDTNDNFKIVDEFCNFGGTCIQVHGNYLYTGGPYNVYRYTIDADTGLVSDKDEPKAIVRGVLTFDGEGSPVFVVDDQRNLYLHIISRTNACQSINNDRKPGFPGEMPCPRLQSTAGVWKFNVNKINQTMDMGEFYSTGIRHLRSLAINKEDDVMYGISQGRDSLHELYPQHFTKEEGDALAPDELLKIDRNTNFGYPYCYFDPVSGRRKLMPEYGGDGKLEAQCNSVDKPLAVFTHHNGPNDLLVVDNVFYVAWNGKPKPLVCGGDGSSCDDLTVDTFEIDEDYTFQNYQTLITFHKKADTRPSGLVKMTGSSDLIVSDSVRGKLWKISKA